MAHDRTRCETDFVQDIFMVRGAFPGIFHDVDSAAGCLITDVTAFPPAFLATRYESDFAEAATPLGSGLVPFLIENTEGATKQQLQALPAACRLSLRCDRTPFAQAALRMRVMALASDAVVIVCGQVRGVRLGAEHAPKIVMRPLASIVRMSRKHQQHECGTMARTC